MQSLCNLKSPCNPKGNRCTIGPGDIELAYRELEGHVGPSVHRLPSGLQLDSVLKPIWMQSTIPMQSRHQSVYERAREQRTRRAYFVHPLTQSKASLHNPLSTDKEHPFNPIHGVKIITLSCCNTPSTTHVQTIQSLAKGHTNQILAHTSHHYS